MEYGGNNNLKQFILNQKKKNQYIEEKIIKDIVIQICSGLKEIHKANIIHRDLTPENIFINQNNKIKIGDFGVSKQLNTNNKYAKTDTGKEHYKAPEIIKNEKYDIRCDIYSLGCIIYELFTLNEYYIDKYFDDKDGKIDIELYNPKWQKLINSLLKKKYNERPFIDEIYNELIEIKTEKICAEIDLDLKNYDNIINNHYTIKYLRDEPKGNDYKRYKVIMLGDSDVNKELILGRFTENYDYFRYYLATVGIYNYNIYYKINDFKMKITIVDIAGLERYSRFPQVRFADLGIIVYDISSYESFKRLDKYISNWKEYKSHDSPFFIVGKNNELESERVISFEKGKNFSIEKGATYFTECSTKTGENINEIFLEIGKCLYQDYIRDRDIEREDSFKLNSFELIDENSVEIKENRICLSF